jgi:hypothetical protein
LSFMLLRRQFSQKQSKVVTLSMDVKARMTVARDERCFA